MSHPACSDGLVNTYEHYLVIDFIREIKGISPGVVVNLLDSDIAVCKFEVQWDYYVQFSTNTRGNGYGTPYSPVLG